MITESDIDNLVPFSKTVLRLLQTKQYQSESGLLGDGNNHQKWFRMIQCIDNSGMDKILIGYFNASSAIGDMLEHFAGVFINNSWISSEYELVDLYGR